MRPILLIEDDPAIAALLAALCADEGYPTEVATSTDTARALLAARGPAGHSLVLTDALASAHDAYTWVDELRTLTDAPLLVCSGWPPQRFEEYRAHGVAALLTKPFDLDDALALIAPLVSALCSPRL